MRNLFAVAVSLGLASVAAADPVLEVEPNNTMATANFIPASAYPSGAFSFDGTIGTTDVDWIRFTLTQATIINAATFGRPDSTTGDSQIILVANDQTTILAYDDDSGIAFFSAMEKTVPAGSYFIGVTAYDDLGLGPNGTNPPHLPTGAHPQTTAAFDYKLVVGFNPVPAPGSAALLGISGALLLRRRRSSC